MARRQEIRWRARRWRSVREMEDAREILWKDFVGLRCERRIERGAWMGVLATSFRI